MYAIIETGGKQYKVENGDIISVEKLDVEAGKKVTFDKVLAVSDDGALKVGNPFIDGMTVEGKVTENGKGKKIIVFKYKAKKDSKTKQGHRQPYTMVEISSIGGKTTKAAAKKQSATSEKAPAKKTAAKKDAPKKDAAKKEATKKEEKKAAKKETAKVSASMKKDELIQYAKDNGIEIDTKAKKADIIDAINKAK